MSGKEFLESVDKVFDNAAKVLNLSSSLSNQIKAPNATYKVNFGVRIKNKMRIFSPTHGFNRTYNDRRGTLLNGLNNSEGYWWIVYILPELARTDIMVEYPGHGSGGLALANYEKLIGGGGQNLLEQIALTKITIGFKTFQDIPPGMR